MLTQEQIRELRGCCGGASWGESPQSPSTRFSVQVKVQDTGSVNRMTVSVDRGTNGQTYDYEFPRFSLFLVGEKALHLK